MVAFDGSEDSEINIRGLDDCTIAGPTADDTDGMESMEQPELDSSAEEVTTNEASSTCSDSDPFHVFDTTDEGRNRLSTLPCACYCKGRDCGMKGGFYGDIKG